VNFNDCHEDPESIRPPTPADIAVLRFYAAVFRPLLRLFGVTMETTALPEPTPKPRSVRELLDYLDEHPKVAIVSSQPSWNYDHPKEIRVYSHTSRGGLWFTNPKDRNRPCYVPISCGQVDSETGLEFTESGFAVTKFGVTFTYTYID
jgi:hypothetical protein